jgi:hypothetical protein
VNLLTKCLAKVRWRKNKTEKQKSSGTFYEVMIVSGLFNELSGVFR